MKINCSMNKFQLFMDCKQNNFIYSIDKRSLPSPFLIESFSVTNPPIPSSLYRFFRPIWLLLV